MYKIKCYDSKYYGYNITLEANTSFTHFFSIKSELVYIYNNNNSRISVLDFYLLLAKKDFEFIYFLRKLINYLACYKFDNINAQYFFYFTPLMRETIDSPMQIILNHNIIVANLLNYDNILYYDDKLNLLMGQKNVKVNEYSDLLYNDTGSEYFLTLPLENYYEKILINKIKNNTNTPEKKELFYHYHESLNLNKFSWIADMNMYIDYISSIGILALILASNKRIYNNDNNAQQLKINIEYNTDEIILDGIEPEFNSIIETVFLNSYKKGYCLHFRGQASSYMHCKIRDVDSAKSWNDLSSMYNISNHVIDNENEIKNIEVVI
jgi:hypothetical protein